MICPMPFTVPTIMSPMSCIALAGACQSGTRMYGVPDSSTVKPKVTLIRVGMGDGLHGQA